MKSGSSSCLTTALFLHSWCTAATARKPWACVSCSSACSAPSPSVRTTFWEASRYDSKTLTLARRQSSGTNWRLSPTSNQGWGGCGHDLTWKYWSPQPRLVQMLLLECISCFGADFWCNQIWGISRDSNQMEHFIHMNHDVISLIKWKISITKHLLIRWLDSLWPVDLTKAQYRIKHTKGRPNRKGVCPL